MSGNNLYPVIDSIGYGNTDSLHALVFYYLLSQQSNSHAEDWFGLNYARCLFPGAAMASQRISEVLAMMGLEGSKRPFFAAYCAYVKKIGAEPKKTSWAEDAPEDGGGILVGSTGLPDSAHLPITAVSNHNGDINNGTRLIYVIQQGTGPARNLPSWMPVIIIKKNAGALVDAKIPFMTGCMPTTRYSRPP